MQYYTKATFTDEIFMFKANTEGETYDIENYEQPFVRDYILGDIPKELDGSDLYKIHNDIRYAIYNHHIGMEVQDCLCKMISANPKMALKLIKDRDIFLKLTTVPYSLDYLNDYVKVNKNYRYNFLYSNVMYFTFNVEALQYLEEFVEYSLIEAVMNSCNWAAFDLLVKYYEKFPVCYKIVDWENEMFTREERQLDFNEIAKKMKFNEQSYKYSYYEV